MEKIKTNKKARLFDLESRIGVLENKLKYSEDKIYSLQRVLYIVGITNHVYPDHKLGNSTTDVHGIKTNIEKEIKAIHKHLGIEWKETPVVPEVPATRELASVKKKIEKKPVRKKKKKKPTRRRAGEREPVIFGKNINKR